MVILIILDCVLFFSPQKIPGVLQVFTAKDIPGQNNWFVLPGAMPEEVIRTLVVLP